MIAREMDKIRASLDERLAAKGLQENEIDLFIKDVARIANVSTELNLETIKRQLHLLGWQENYVDYGIIQLIQAYHQDT